MVRDAALPRHAQFDHHPRAPGNVQPELRPADPLRLPQGPQGRHAHQRGQYRGNLRGQVRHGRHPNPQCRRECRGRGRDQHRGEESQHADVVPGLRRRDRAGLHHVPLMACGGVRGGAADGHLGAVRGLDGGAEHRRQSRHVAGDRTGRGHRRGLRVVCDDGDPDALESRHDVVAGVLQGADFHRQGGGAHRYYPGHRGGHLGVVADQVPG